MLYQEWREKTNELIEEEKWDEAIATLKGAYENDSQDPDIYMMLMSVLFRSGRIDDAVTLYSQFPPDLQQTDEGQRWGVMVQFAQRMQSGPDIQTIQADLAQDSTNVEALENLAAFLMVAGQHAQACDVYLRIMQIGGDHFEPAKETLIAIFKVLEKLNPTVANDYRRKMMTLLV